MTPRAPPSPFLFPFSGVAPLWSGNNEVIVSRDVKHALINASVVSTVPVSLSFSNDRERRVVKYERKEGRKEGRKEEAKRRMLTENFRCASVEVQRVRV